MLQKHARKHVIPIDSLEYTFTVAAFKEPQAVEEAPVDGCYVHGLFLEAAAETGAEQERALRELVRALAAVPAELDAELPATPPGTPPEISVYSMEGYYRGDSCQLRRYTLRLDGFVSANAPLRGGELVTRPFTFAGTELSLNFATSAAGSVRVEIQEETGQAVEGFAMAQCEEIYGDDVDHVVRWESGSDAGALSGKPVRLRFALSDADLYSLVWR